MGDFYQNGIITNFHNLRSRDTEELERELTSFSRKRPMTLVLPSLYSELEGNALPRIVEILKDVPYLEEIIIGLDRADEKQFRQAKEFFSVLPQQHRILWQDGPNLRAIDKKLSEHDLSPTHEGKGRNVWYCYGYVLASGRSQSVAMHDCDILTYDRSMLARLIYPVANPAFNYEFCKGYYFRCADGELKGRASRLLVTPLLRTLKKIFGYNDYLEYLDSYRYPLSGEFSMRTDLLNDIRIPSDWGLEIGVLSEVKHNFETRRICQVDIADRYDHKHQPLSRESIDNGLSKMTLDISKALFRKLATCGIVFDKGKFRTIKATYYRIALDFIETYYNDAMMNGLSLDRHAEEEAVELFAANILEAGKQFLDHPLETPFIPSWNRVSSALPNVLEHIYEAVEKDNE
jgi:glucosyl-3-phosphoglycerate synthase